MNVAVIGASENPQKYSHQAVLLLREKGHSVYPVHPKTKMIEGIKVYWSISDVPVPIDTISLYVSPNVSTKIAGDILKKSPRRIIFNPGAENDPLLKKAQAAGIETLEACTLVMLKTGQF